MRRIELDDSYIVDQYLNKKLSLDSIAESIGLSKDVVSRRIKELGIKLRVRGRQPIELEINREFDDLTIVNIDTCYKGKGTKYICLCKCGVVVSVIGTSLLSGNTKRCWKCRGDSISKKKRKGYEEISGEFWNRVEHSAKVRNFKVEITIEDAWKLFIRQNRRCALSGVDIVFNKRKEDIKFATASLDRIDSTKHYIKGNVQWVHKIINNLKMDLDQIEFIDWCKKVAANATT